MPTPHGNIRVSWKRVAEGVIEANIETPKGVSLHSTNPKVRVNHKVASVSSGSGVAAPQPRAALTAITAESEPCSTESY